MFFFCFYKICFINLTCQVPFYKSILIEIENRRQKEQEELETRLRKEVEIWTNQQLLIQKNAKINPIPLTKLNDNNNETFQQGNNNNDGSLSEHSIIQESLQTIEAHKIDDKKFTQEQRVDFQSQLPKKQ